MANTMYTLCSADVRLHSTNLLLIKNYCASQKKIWLNRGHEVADCGTA